MQMKKLILLGFLCFFYGYNSSAQMTSSIRGKTIEKNSGKLLKKVTVIVENSSLFVETDLNGDFLIQKIMEGEHILLINFGS